MDILDTTYTSDWRFLIAPMFILGSLALVLLIASISDAIQKQFTSVCRRFLFCLGSITLALLLGWIVSNTTIVEHKVIIDDISQLDYSKYEIINQKGRLFIIREIQ